MSEGSKFAADIKKFVSVTKEKADQSVRKIALALFSNVVLASPVDTGRFRGNWQIGIGVAPTEVLDRKTAGEEGSKLADAKLGTVVFIVNNLPYARRLEYGWSDQAPNGIVRLAMSNLDSIVKDIK